MNRSQAATLSFLFALFFCVSAAAGDGVLRSSANEGGEDAGSSTLVPAVATAPEAVSGAPKNSGTAKLTFKSKSTAPGQPEAGVPAKDSEAKKSVETEESEIFRSTSPHAAAPQGTSPFIKQVSADAAPYRRMPIVSRGKTKPSSSDGAPATIRRKSDTTEST